MSDDKTPYKPRPGSIGEQAIAYLAIKGRCSARDLADGIECEHGSLHASLNMAVLHGLVLRDAVDQITYYTLPVMTQQADVPVVGDSAKVDAAQMRQAWSEAERGAAESSRFECGVYSDGRMVLEIGDSVYTFTRAERERLMRFLVGGKAA